MEKDLVGKKSKESRWLNEVGNRKGVIMLIVFTILITLFVVIQFNKNNLSVESAGQVSLVLIRIVQFFVLYSEKSLKKPFTNKLIYTILIVTIVGEFLI